jgi:hypothetical protein
MNKDQKMPSPLVTVDKKYGREVLVGIVDSNRQLTNGFSSDWPASIHYRTLRHGTFSVLVGARLPVEVRVMMDGKLLCEQFLDPLPSPSTAGSKSDVVRKIGELTNRPQPFFISFDDEGANLRFTADQKGRSAEELLRLQLNPEPLTPVNGPALVRVGQLPTSICEAQVDIPAPLALPINTKAAAKASEPGIVTTSEELDHESEGGGTNPPAPSSEPAKLIPAQVDATGTVLPNDHQIQAPLPEFWAPSSGLVVIGVRMVQTQQEGEPTMPPDGFEYVPFQLNTWEDHSRIRANLHSRIKLGPRIKFPELVDDKEPGVYESTTPGGVCGHSHGHNPRRFK